MDWTRTEKAIRAAGAGFALVMGLAAVVTGICTMTLHNAAIGAMVLAVGYTCRKAE